MSGTRKRKRTGSDPEAEARTTTFLRPASTVQDDFVGGWMNMVESSWISYDVMDSVYRIHTITFTGEEEELDSVMRNFSRFQKLPLHDNFLPMETAFREADWVYITTRASICGTLGSFFKGGAHLLVDTDMGIAEFTPMGKKFVRGLAAGMYSIHAKQGFIGDFSLVFVSKYITEFESDYVARIASFAEADAKELKAKQEEDRETIAYNLKNVVAAVLRSVSQKINTDEIDHQIRMLRNLPYTSAHIFFTDASWMSSEQRLLAIKDMYVQLNCPGQAATLRKLMGAEVEANFGAGTKWFDKVWKLRLGCNSSAVSKHNPSDFITMLRHVTEHFYEGYKYECIRRMKNRLNIFNIRSFERYIRSQFPLLDVRMQFVYVKLGWPFGA